MLNGLRNTWEKKRHFDKIYIYYNQERSINLPCGLLHFRFGYTFCL